MTSENTLANLSDHSGDIYLQEWKAILENSMLDTDAWLRVLFATVLVVIFVTGVCGNLLTCIVIYCHQSMHTATNYYLLNMAGSDLLVSFGILIDINGFMKYPYDIDGFGDIVCKINFFLVGVLWNNSVLTITALAIERFIAVWFPLFLSKQHEQRRVMRIIFFIWTIAIIETAPEICTANLVQSRKFSVCFIVPTPFAKQLNGILGLITFLLPLGIMVLMYTLVSFKVSVTQAGCRNPGSQIFNHRNSRSKVNKLIMALTVSFMLCWLPFFVLRIVIYKMDVQRLYWFLQNWELLLMASSFNCWFSIVLNPLLFSLMSTKFRTALKELWNAKLKTLRPKRVNNGA